MGGLIGGEGSEGCEFNRVRSISYCSAREALDEGVAGYGSSGLQSGNSDGSELSILETRKPRSPMLKDVVCNTHRIRSASRIAGREK